MNYVLILLISLSLIGCGGGSSDSSNKTPDPAPIVDSDNDGVADSNDAFPNDATETKDTDSDGVGDNSDAFPYDSTETLDSDGDSVGDNSDAFPNDATETIDSDADGIGDNADLDDDNDECVDTHEIQFGTNPLDGTDCINDFNVYQESFKGKSYHDIQFMGLNLHELKLEFKDGTIYFQSDPIAIGDFSGDGLVDVMASKTKWVNGEPTIERQSIYIFINQGNGRFIENSESIFDGELPTVLHPRKIIIGDFNGDDYIDAFVADTGYDAYPFPGDTDTLILSISSGKYETKIIHPNIYTHGATSVDIDNDGDIDLIYADSGTGSLFLMDNDGAGNFSESTLMTIGGGKIYTIEAIDVDGDGCVELLTGGNEHNYNAYIHHFDCGKRIKRNTLLPNNSSFSVSLDFDFFDFDGDGSKELSILRTGGGKCALDYSCSNPASFYEGWHVEFYQVNSYPILQYTKKDRIQGWMAWLYPAKEGFTLYKNKNRYSILNF